MINQGASKTTKAERGEDYYPTPTIAFETLMRWWPPPQRLWDCCAGRGELSVPLTALGCDVTATDLIAWPGADASVIPGVDFLTTPHVPRRLEAIVMNPPFGLMDSFVRKALLLAPQVAVFARLMFIEGIGRSDYMDNFLCEVIAGKERLPMMHREGYEGKKLDKSAVPFGWFIFSQDRNPIPGCSILRRVSWYDNAKPSRLEPPPCLPRLVS